MSFPVLPLPESIPLDTQKALLLLDLQNEFVSAAGKLPILNVTSFLHKLPSLVASFRDKGDVVWVRTEFQQPRSTFSMETGNHAILLKEFLSPEAIELVEENVRETGGDVGRVEQGESQAGNGHAVESSMDAATPDPEAFLAPILNISTQQRCCLPGTVGCEYPNDLHQAIDRQKDLDLVKTNYSAFSETSLLLHLRMRRVTELYVCGSLSNVSVYATVMDAVRHGLDVVLIEDCLGYQNEDCHLEVVRQMVDSMGANGTDYQELMDDLAGLLGDVVHEADFTTRYQVSLPTAPPVAPPRRRGPGVGEHVFSMDGRSTKSSTPASEIVQTPSNLPEQSGLNTHGLLNRSESSPRSIKQLTPDPSPPRKRSTSDLGELDDERVPKLTQKPSIRRASHEAYSSERPKQRQNKPRIRRQRPSQESSVRPTPPDLNTLGQSYSTGDIPDNVEMTSDCDVADTDRRMSLSDPNLAPEKPKKKSKRKTSTQYLGPGDPVGQGDSQLILDIMPAADAENAFFQLKTSVQWQKMFHRSGEVPRLVAVQGEADESGNYVPIYRHPADESPGLLPFDTAVSPLRGISENLVGHPLNHVLIQWYRNGEDNISEHSDKSLDIVRGSKIVNLSLGARRTMTLRTKKSQTITKTEQPIAGRTNHRIALSHNSLFVLGSETNRYWLHSIRPDKRPISEKNAEELAYGGERISLTFRHIGTFIDPATSKIWGQGATVKTREAATNILEGVQAEKEGEAMIRAFGQENHQSDTWDWNQWYGRGFDVVNSVTNDV